LIGDLKLAPGMLVPPGEHNGVSVYTMYPNGKKSWISQNHMTDCHQKLVVFSPSDFKNFIKICNFWSYFSYKNGQTLSCDLPGGNNYCNYNV